MSSKLMLVSLAALTTATLALPAAAEYGQQNAKCQPATAKCSTHKCMAKCGAKKCAPKCGAKCHPKCGAKK